MMYVRLTPAYYFAIIILLLTFLTGCQAGGTRVEVRRTLTELPSLEQALKMSDSRYSAGLSSFQGLSEAEATFETKRNYSLILARREQLRISKEVKGHFEKAVSQAQKKFEEEEGDITQSAITKLKLGLAGTLNDISQFKSDIALAKLRLEKYLGVQWAEATDISGPGFQPVDFPYKTVEEIFNNRASNSNNLNKKKLYDLKEVVIDVNKAREQLNLAAKNRKMTRALLVTEAANYDFGIGNEADLFEALIIYTRVLVGYYEAIHAFNVTVYRVQSLISSNE